MANVIKVKRSAVAGKIPATTDLQLGELAINTFDGKLFIKKNDGTESIVELGTGGGGGGGGASVTISSDAPTTANSGDLWWDSETGTLKIYYQDENSSQWVDASSSIFSTVNYITSDGVSTLTNKTISYADNTLTGVAPLASPTFTGTVTASTINLGTALGVQYGGTGASSLTSNSVLLGNGTSTVQSVAPSTTGNVLTSNGTTWVSSPPAPSFTTGKAIAMAIVFGA